MKLFLLGLLSMIIFSVIDSSIFLFVEEGVDDFLIKKTPLDHISRPLLLSGFSASVAILCASSIEHKLVEKFNIVKHPVIDSIGIIIGTIIVITCYEIYKLNGGRHEVATRANRNP